MFDGLTKSFGQKIAVDAVTLTVDTPMTVGIIGRFGAGMSTLLRMMNRLTTTSSGRLIWGGRDIMALRGRVILAWQSDCAMILHHFNLVPRMDVVSNVLHRSLNHLPSRRSSTSFPSTRS